MKDHRESCQRNCGRNEYVKKPDSGSFVQLDSRKVAHFPSVNSYFGLSTSDSLSSSVTSTPLC
jgi:hypothetical protein